MITVDKRKQIAFHLFFSGLVLLVAVLPLSMFMMSISQFIILGGWLIDGNIGEKIKGFFSNKIALLLSSVYLMHLFGLFYTTDFEYAFKDLRIKLPLLLLPLVLSTGPSVSANQFKKILLALIAGVTVSTLISLLVYLGIFKRPVIDIRDISIFISHIRLALLCCLSVFVSYWLIYQHRKETINYYLIILLPVSLWLIGFLVLIESLTGAAILLIGAIIFSFWVAFKEGNKLIRILLIVIALGIPYVVYNYLHSVNESVGKHETVDYSKLEKYTQSGNEYYHYPGLEEYENGYSIWIYQCETEMEPQWNKRSSLNYKGKDKRNQELRFTLMRFLTSKGLRKDSAGVWALSDSEIRSVENGVANVLYQDKSNFTARIRQSIWEFTDTSVRGDPSGHSVTQRFEYWRTAWAIIRENPVFGVGTGDVPKAFEVQYEIQQSKLKKEWRLRSHNQYLSIGVAFGIIGMIWFILSLTIPLMVQIKKKDILYCSFALIAIISMISEDTLETQAGVTFFALFGSLFLFVNPLNQFTGGKRSRMGVPPE